MGIFHRVWRDQARGVPEVDPETRGRNNPCARARTKVLALLFERREAPIRMREAPLGMLVNYTLITPRDDCPIQKVMNNILFTGFDRSSFTRLRDPTSGRGESSRYLAFSLLPNSAVASASVIANLLISGCVTQDAT